MPNTSVRAAAEGMPSLNRRKALALTASGIAATLASMAATTIKAHPAAAARVMQVPANPDVAIRPLVAAWRKARKEVDLYCKVHTACEERFFAMSPERPVRKEVSEEEQAAFRNIKVSEIADWKWAGADENLAADAAWAIDYERAKVESGLQAAGEIFDALLAVESDAASRVLYFPIRTMDGLKAKLRVHATYEFDPYDFTDVLIRDIRRVAKGVAS